LAGSSFPIHAAFDGRSARDTNLRLTKLLHAE
jgi:hypothetical protein